MKKIFLFAAAAMVSLSSCVQTEDVYTGGLNEIGFKSAAVRADGANVVDGVEFTGAMTVAGAWDQTKGVYKQYFAPTKFVKDAGASVWSGDPARYWPFGGQMQFVAYYPHEFGTFAENVDDTNGITHYTVSGIDNETSQYDVLYSDRVYCADVPTSTQALVFHHALTQIEVNFATNDANASVKLKEVTLNSVHFGGDLKVNCANDESTAEWTSKTTAGEHTFVNVTEDALGTEYNKDATTVLILPAETQTSITITYTHGNENKELTKVVDLSANGKWEMGKKYIYNFCINMNEIDFTVTVDTWDGVVVPGITI